MGTLPRERPAHLGRPPPVNQGGNRRWGCLPFYSHPSTLRIKRQGNERGKQCGSSVASGGLLNTPALGVLDVGASLFLSLSFPWPPLPSPPTLSGPWSYVRVCWAGRKWADTGDREMELLLNLRQGSVWAAPEHGETTPER